MKRMSRHMTTEWLVDVCGEGAPFPAQISEVLAISLENEVKRTLGGLLYHDYTCCTFAQDDAESQLVALTILSELLSKLPDVFGEQFTRLGLYMLIANLAAAPASGADDSSDVPAATASKAEKKEVRGEGS